MESPRRFGDYVLFKRLDADDLGESYRAGRVAGAGIERVVLLRLFNGRTIDRPGLWRAVADRGPVQKLLTSARLAEGIELGVVAGTPFAAYAYVSGPSLLALVRQARAKPFPIPTEHALFIAERTAQRLLAARETRIQGERLHHGFLVPALVSLSVEGEVQVLGAELAPGLRAQPELRSQAEIAPYLAPEAAAGQPVHPADDVYSLAAMLYELLSGDPPPADTGEFGAALDAATLATGGTPLPPPIVALLRDSLAPRESRLAGVDQWHRSLAGIVAEGGHGPSTFNFAFFLHTLLREEIDGERQEIEREASHQVPAAEAAAPVAGPPPPATAARPIGVGRAAAASGSRRSRWLVPGLSAGILLIAALLAAYHFLDWRSWLEPEGRAAPAVPAAAAGEAAEKAEEGAEGGADAPAPSVEEVEAQVRELLAQRTPEMETEVRAEFEAKLGSLRRQLAEARAAARRRQEARQRAEAAAAASGADAESPGPRPGVAAEPPAPSRPAAPSAVAPAAPAPAAGREAPAERPAATETTGAAAETKAAEPPAEPSKVAAPPVEPAAAEPVLVEPEPLLVPPRMLSRPQPQYPPAARKFGKEATVRLRLLIDASGQVADSERIGPKAGYGFDEAALRAARKTSWAPATRDGTPVEAWVELSVEFRP